MLLLQTLRKLPSIVWKARKQVLLYAIFVAISAFFALLNKLNHEYTIEVARNILLDNTPFGMRVLAPDQHKVTYRIKGHGYSLLSYKGITYTAPLRINYQDSLRIFSNFYTHGATLNREDLSRILTRHLPPDLQLLGIVTDSVDFHFDKQLQKKVPIRSRFQYTLETQTMLVAPPRITPDSVAIIGTESVLSAIQEIQTIAVDLGRLSDNYATTLPLDIPSGVALAQESVHLDIRIETYTQKDFTTPIRVRNLPDSLRMNLIPSTLTVSCNLPLSYYDSLSAKQLHFWVEPDSALPSPRLRVQLDSLPTYVANLKFHPQYVEYYISKE